MQRPTSSSAKRVQTSTLDQETLYSLHKTIFGHEQREWPEPWKCGFAFRERAMTCGLLQREGGPCGVLAAVQAFILREVYAAAEDNVDPNTVDPAARMRRHGGS